MLKTLSDNKQIMPVCVHLSSLTNFLPTFLFPHFSSKKPHCWMTVRHSKVGHYSWSVESDILTQTSRKITGNNIEEEVDMTSKHTLYPLAGQGLGLPQEASQ